MSDESVRLVTQDDALPGSLHLEYKACGRPSCRCARDELHGPYWYRRWSEGSRQRKEYVPTRELERVRTAIAEWRRLHPPAWPIRQALGGWVPTATWTPSSSPCCWPCGGG